MKKIFTIILSVGFVLSISEATAQQMMQSVPQFKKSVVPRGHTIEKATKTFRTMHPPAAAAGAPGDTRWYSYFDAKDLYAGGAGVLVGNYLFPDSNITAEFSGSTFGTPWVHNIANSFDPTSIFFNDPANYPGEMALNATSEYSVDSLEILFAYVNDSSWSDTVVIELNFTVPADANGFIGNVASNLGVDTVFFRDLKYDSTDNQLNMTGNIVIEVLIDSAFARDTTSTGWNVISISTGALADLDADNLLAVNVYVKPGFSYSLSDTVQRMSLFVFECLEENGDNTYPAYEKKDDNTTYIAPTDVKYNLPSAGGWAGSFIPSYAYMGTTAGYGFENLLISYKVTCITGCGSTDVNDPIALNGFSVSQNRPNPANGNTEINFNLEQASTAVTFKVMDVLGRDVRFMDLGEKSPGMHKIDFSTEGLENGVYFYSITCNGKTVSKKMVVGQ